MAEIRINTGLIRLGINRDGEQVGAISFNPNDVRFVEGYYNLYQHCTAQFEQYQQRLEQIAEGNYSGQFAIIHEFVQDMEERIDQLFGEGTSKVAFGDAECVEMFNDFFAAIIPHISRSREAAASRYLNANSDILR